MNHSLDLPACYIVFRLVAGEPPAGLDFDALGEPYRSGAQAVMSANGQGRPAAFNRWLATLETSLADDIRRAMRAWQVAGQPDCPAPATDVEAPDPTPEVPELPRPAQLTSQMQRAARSCGQWLDDYVAFANLAAPNDAGRVPRGARHGHRCDGHRPPRRSACQHDPHLYQYLLAAGGPLDVVAQDDRL